MWDLVQYLWGNNCTSWQLPITKCCVMPSLLILVTASKKPWPLTKTDITKEYQPSQLLLTAAGVSWHTSTLIMLNSVLALSLAKNTGTILFMGIRNKYFTMCKKGIDENHHCFWIGYFCNESKCNFSKILMEVLWTAWCMIAAKIVHCRHKAWNTLNKVKYKYFEIPCQNFKYKNALPGRVLPRVHNI